MDRCDPPILDGEGRIVVGRESWDGVDKVLKVGEKLRLAAIDTSCNYHRYCEQAKQALHDFGAVPAKVMHLY